MIVRDIQRIIEAWAPKELAWERDNVGLQVGSPTKRVGRILVTLDVTDRVVLEARRMNADLIVSHHPLLFRPLAAIDTDERIGRLVAMLTRHNIALYSAHTNLDFASGGVSFSLAARLGLRSVEVLGRDQFVEKKIVVFVPPSHLDRVRSAMAAAGAGSIGHYDLCSFGAPGTGTFRPLKSARPYVGTRGTFERIEEIRLEMRAPAWKVAAVVAAMRSAHPYEEVAYDVYALADASPQHGAGAIGDLRPAMASGSFLAHVSRRLRIPVLRHRNGPRRRISRVAVCGGSGSDLMGVALRRGADAFITADISYHRFEATDGKMLLVDAGHYESELPVVKTMASTLATEIGRLGRKVRVVESSITTNPVDYYYHA